MQEVSGFYIHGGLALPGHDLVLFVHNQQRRLQAKHEVFHLIAADVWGITNSRLLNEGGAVYADNECYYENPIYTINAYMLQNRKLLPLQSLISNFDNVARENDVIAYLQSAGIFKYLYEKYGVDKMKALWLQGFDNFEKVYGISITKMEKDWKTELKKINIPNNIDWEKLMKDGCG